MPLKSYKRIVPLLIPVSNRDPDGSSERVVTKDEDEEDVVVVVFVLGIVIL